MRYMGSRAHRSGFFMAMNMTEEIFNEGKMLVCLHERRAETGRLLPGVINCQTRWRKREKERYVSNALPRSH